jgi:chromosome segregation ATPase
VAADPAPAETTPSAVRYRVTLPAKQDAALTVTERHAGDTTYRLTDFDDRTIAVLIRGGASEAALRRALQPLIDKRAELTAAESRLSAIASQVAEIDRDQARVRENMKALKGTAEEKALLQRYTRELNDQEDKLASLRDEQKKATADRDARRRELADLAAHLTFDLTS